jgi:hypothetical protein
MANVFNSPHLEERTLRIPWTVRHCHDQGQELCQSIH